MPVDIFRQNLGQEQRNCQTHGKLTSTGQQIRIGRVDNVMWTKCPACVKALAATDQADAQRAVTQKKLDHIATVLDQSAIPKRFIGRTFENFTAETPDQMITLRTARRYVAQFDSVLKTGRTLIFFKGNPGTGKSHLACAILQHIMPEHVGVHTTTMDLVRKLREGWGGKPGSELRCWQRWAPCRYWCSTRSVCSSVVRVSASTCTTCWTSAIATCCRRS